MSRYYSAATVVQVSKATYRQIDYWARTDLLKPSGKSAAGKGSRRGYTFGDLIAAQTVARLVAGKCPLQKIRAAAEYLRKNDPSASTAEALAKLVLLTDGETVLVSRNGQEFMELMSRQTVWGVPLGQMISETRGRLETLSLEWVESVEVFGKTYHLKVNRYADSQQFAAACKELPGVLEKGSSAEAVVKKACAAIEAVVEHQRRARIERPTNRHKRSGA